MRTFASPGAEARLRLLAPRAERAAGWLAEALGAPFTFDLLVLDEDDWAEHAKIPIYGMPHSTGDGKVVVGSRPATLFDSVCMQFWPDFGRESREAVQRVYGDPPALQPFADLILVHEVTHVVPRSRPLPEYWQEELFANLGTIGYLASEEPDELPVYTTLNRAGCDVPPSRVPFSQLADMRRGLEEGGAANYGWYQFRITTAAERLWHAHGVEALRALQAGDLGLARLVERDWP